MFQIIVALLLIVADQLVKRWVLEAVPLYATRDFLPPLVELTHFQNTGAAWSSFQGMRWLLVALSTVISVAIVVALVRRIVRHPLGRWALTIVLAGAVGNLIDRVFRGSVVDMFHFMFINFPIFNVADICVVIGGILTAVYFIWFYEKYDAKKEQGNGLDLR